MTSEIEYQQALDSEELAMNPDPGGTQGFPTLRKGIVTSLDPLLIDDIPAFNVTGVSLGVGHIVWMLVDSGKRLVFGSAEIGAGGGGLVETEVISRTSPGSFEFKKGDFPDGFAIRTIVQGGGGGSGGTAATSTGFVSEAGGGGGGGAVRSRLFKFEDLDDTIPYEVGAGGAGGAAGNNTGGAGEASTFGSSSGELWFTAGMAGGGGGGGSSSSTSTTGFGGVGGGTLALTGRAVSTHTGGAGGHGLVVSGDTIRLNYGGGSLHRLNVRSNTALGTNGVNGTMGTGGAGPRNSSGQAARAGGNGGNGLIIIEVFKR